MVYHCNCYPAQTVCKGASRHKEYCYTVLGCSKYPRISREYHCHWFKSYSIFAEWVDFAFWWSCIRKGLRSEGLSCLVHVMKTTHRNNLNMYWQFLIYVIPKFRPSVRERELPFLWHLAYIGIKSIRICHRKKTFCSGTFLVYRHFLYNN